SFGPRSPDHRQTGKVLRSWKCPLMSCFQISSSASSLKMRTRIGEYFGIFFCRSSESSAGGNSFVALAGNSVVGLPGNSVVPLVGNGLLSWPRHATGVSAAARAAGSTSARTTAVPIITMPPDLEPLLSGCLQSVAFVGQTQAKAPQNDARYTVR